MKTNVNNRVLLVACREMKLVMYHNKIPQICIHHEEDFTKRVKDRCEAAHPLLAL